MPTQWFFFYVQDSFGSTIWICLFALSNVWIFAWRKSSKDTHTHAPTSWWFEACHLLESYHQQVRSRWNWGENFGSKDFAVMILACSIPYRHVRKTNISWARSNAIVLRHSWSRGWSHTWRIQRTTGTQTTADNAWLIQTTAFDAWLTQSREHDNRFEHHCYNELTTI